MTFSELFNSGFKQRNQDHFAAIVRIAMDDDVVIEEEKAFLDRLARKLEISKAMYATIMKDYKTHPINPPATTERRLERLFDLARMVYADHIKDEHEVQILTKIAVGLGYTKDPKAVVNKALDLVADGSIDVEEFKEKMKR
ncbi:MAG: TerB family tellurite resistance protein [Flavobacteriaceae bacterium]|nr:TerB family tellurite resistance protein [Flavobacteriaceae bacterium]